jgi:hypothetical protein
MSMTAVPPKFHRYLWDVDLTQLDPIKHQTFIIERFLEYGDEAALKWLQQTYSKEDIIQILKSSRKISVKTGNFYAILYQLDPTELTCIQQPFTQKQNRF